METFQKTIVRMPNLYVINFENPTYEKCAVLKFIVPALKESSFEKIIVISENGSYQQGKIVEKDFVNQNFFSKCAFLLILRVFQSLFFFLFQYSIRDRLSSAAYTARICFYAFKFCLLYFFRIKGGDKILVINSGYLCIGVIFKVFKNIVYDFMIYEIYPFQTLERRSLRNKMHCFFEKFGLEKVNQVFDYGEGKAFSFLNRYYKLQLKKLVKINIIPEKPPVQSRQTVTLPLKFYYHGALFPHRGLLELVEAVSHFGAEQATLHLRGFGPLEEQLKEACKANKNTVVLPPIDTEMLSLSATDYDIGLTMVSMDVFAHRFSNGFKTYENLAAGVALVVPNGPNIKPLIDKYSIGIMYNDTTPTELTRVIQYCIDHVAEVEQWKRNIQIINTEQYTGDHYRAVFLKAIESR